MFAALWFALALLGTADAQEAGGVVSKTGVVDDDLYLAGGRVDVGATVSGDAVAAGFRVRIGGDIEGDVIAAGALVTVVGRVADDARLAGGQIEVESAVGDDLIAAGGMVTVLPSAAVEGDTRLVGGRVDMRGTLRRGLDARAGAINISGTIDGDVDLAAGEIEITETAEIDGNLIYRSPEEARIAEGARITGRIEHEAVKRIGIPGPPDAEAFGFAATAFGVVWLLGLTVVGLVLLLAAPRPTAAAIDTIRTALPRALGYGFVTLVVVPAAALVCFILVIGAPLGLALVAGYFVALLVAYVTTGLWLADAALERLRRRPVESRLWRTVGLFVTLIVLSALGWIPILGFVVILFTLSAGLGGWVIAARSRIAAV